MPIRGTVPGPWADGYEASKRARREDEPDGLSWEAGDDLADAAFYCPRCGTPISQDPTVEAQERKAGMCLQCASTSTVIGGE